MSTPEPCASSDERDTQDTSEEEPRQERNTQDTPARSIETRNPTCLGGTPSGSAAAMAALAGLTALERCRRRSSGHTAPTKNEEKR